MNNEKLGYGEMPYERYTHFDPTVSRDQEQLFLPTNPHEEMIVFQFEETPANEHVIFLRTVPPLTIYKLQHLGLDALPAEQQQNLIVMRMDVTDGVYEDDGAFFDPTFNYGLRLAKYLADKGIIGGSADGEQSNLTQK